MFLDWESLPLPDLRIVPAAVAWTACAIMGWIVGRQRSSGFAGAFLGAFGGPLGVIVAFALDGRPRCPRCGERLNIAFIMCRACHAPISWVGAVPRVHNSATDGAPPVTTIGPREPQFLANAARRIGL